MNTTTLLAALSLPLLAATFAAPLAAQTPDHLVGITRAFPNSLRGEVVISDA